MKKTIISYAIASSLISGVIFTGCQSASQEEENAKENVQDAKEELKEVRDDANKEAQKVASAEEWNAFKIETEEKIRNNENRIAELKMKMNKPGKILDGLYEKRIETLEQRNNELKARLGNYEKNQSDWESFKREFNHDMDELGQAFKDITVDNKN